jgi:hypothetical protein
MAPRQFGGRARSIAARSGKYTSGELASSSGPARRARRCAGSQPAELLVCGTCDRGPAPIFASFAATLASSLCGCA